jgi:hypothetical protein
MPSILTSENSTTAPFIVTFLALGFAWTVLYILDSCLQCCLERHQANKRQREVEEHAAVLQAATRRKLSQRVIVSPRRVRGRSRALEFDKSSSDDEAINKPDAADTISKMRTRSSYNYYNSD